MRYLRTIFLCGFTLLVGCNIFGTPDTTQPDADSEFVADASADAEPDTNTADLPDEQDMDSPDLNLVDCVDSTAQFSSPSAAFASSNSALFSMRPLGDFEGYCGFEVQSALTLEDVDGARIETVVELDAPSSTLDYFATSLLPDSEYFFRFRPRGSAVWSDVVTIVTTPSFDPSNAFELFTETLPPGAYPFPPEVRISNGNPFEGSTHLTYFYPECDADRCFENLRIQDLRIPPANGFDASTAVLEFAIWYQDVLEVPWTEIRLNAEEGNVFTLKGVRFQPTTNYAVVQVPFTALADSDGERASDFPWTSFNLFWVGADWPKDTQVHMDSIVVRWR